MGRKCSYCGNTGHNSRTCLIQRRRRSKNGGTGSMKLFGVELDLSSSSSSPFAMRKSFSVGCLLPSHKSTVPSSSSTSYSHVLDKNFDKISSSSGYLSDGLIGRSPDRKKGIPWSEEEHRIFLVGLERLGKGDWRGISKNFVTTRTATQVASHAQKYFLRRQNCLNRKHKRRPSLFDLDKDNSARQEGYNSNIQTASESSMINFSSNLEQDSKSSSQISLPVRLWGKSNLISADSRSNNHSDIQSSPPNLELTLAAAPQTRDQRKPPSTADCLLAGTVAVI